MTAQRSPTPYTAHGLNIYDSEGVLVALVYQDRGAIERHGNSAFIVRACNSHEALVEALEQIRRRVRAAAGTRPERGTIRADVMEICEGALKLAKGEV